MPVNRGSVLSKEYFVSYFQLVMNAWNCGADEAKYIIIERFFHGDVYSYGTVTRKQFELAYQQFEN